MESNDSPEIPDRGETSDIPGLPSGDVTKAVEKQNGRQKVTSVHRLALAILRSED